MNNPKVIENDALVVLCLQGPEDTMTHHEFRVRAAARGFALTRSQCHNLLNRATGRVLFNLKSQWQLTVMGEAYREEVLTTLHRLMLMEVGAAISPDA